MNKNLPIRLRKTTGGQTLIIALIILFVLLVLGFVFLAVISRNIVQAGRSQQRSQSTDLADAGIRYCHNQLLNSQPGADWRPTLTAPINGSGNLSSDPDLLYIRPGSGFKVQVNDAQVDEGGPDGLGPFSRLNFRNGRTLVRVTYGPSDIDFLQTDPSGPLRNPGRARNYLIIESIGRPGALNPNDPTTLPNSAALKYQNFTTVDEFRGALSAMHERDNQFVQSRKLIAFASVGLLINDLFITNKDRVSRDAEIGMPLESGAQYWDEVAGAAVAVNVAQMFGQTVAGVGGVQIAGIGSIQCNANLKYYGTIQAIVNPDFGSGIRVAGQILSADSNSTFQLRIARGSAAPTGAVTVANSNDPGFDTFGGVFRDGKAASDPEGQPRYMQYEAPPSILRVDPDTGFNRYVSMSRDSGIVLTNGNSGQYGHGRNVYINNRADLQTAADESGREQTGASDALFYDWLNPNNGHAGSGWQGPFYVPIGATMQFTSDGFVITRDGRAPPDQRTWRNPDGSDSGLTSIRYRIGQVSGQNYIVNTLTPGVSINNANPGFASGVPFEGVVFFEGNVRVRGIIPTDVQLTVVSLGNIYIEGSITKGVTDNSGNLLTRPSRSMLALLAKDYVVLNTTQFVGAATQQLIEKSSSNNPTAQNPVVMSATGGSLDLISEFLLNPASAGTPAGWKPYATDYRQYNGPGSNTGIQEFTKLLLTHTMDDGPAASSNISMEINPGLGTSSNYFFPPTGNPIYTLGSENWQRYSRFETKGFEIVDPTAFTYMPPPPIVKSTSAEGTYWILPQETALFGLRPNNVGASPTNDYLLARAAIVPHDIRIEACLYAEEGSLFVIPGQWFNPNPNDRRDTFDSLVPSGTTAERNQKRLEDYGNYPDTPFYGEPLDMKVTILGAVSENMPPPIAQQTEWLKKWAWIPREHGSTGELIPFWHVPDTGYRIDQPVSAGGALFVPNLIISYDPMLATARTGGFDPGSSNPPVRPLANSSNMTLPPMPRLPVSPTLAYFGEVNP